MGAIDIQLGQTLPLGLLTNQRLTGKFVKASAFKDDGTPLAGTPLVLTELADGFYRDRSLSMPNTPYLDVVYTVYDDAGLTIQTPGERGNVETYRLSTIEESLVTISGDVMNQADLNATIVESSTLTADIINDAPAKAILEDENTLKALVVVGGEASNINTIIDTGTEMAKNHVNGEAGVMPKWSVAAFDDSGFAVLADANLEDLSDFAGISDENINPGESGKFIKGGNIPDILTGLGAVPGQFIYIGETPGSLSLTPPPGIDDYKFILGKAEPSAGMSGAVTDLYLQPQVLG